MKNKRKERRKRKTFRNTFVCCQSQLVFGFGVWKCQWHKTDKGQTVSDLFLSLSASISVSLCDSLFPTFAPNIKCDISHCRRMKMLRSNNNIKDRARFAQSQCSAPHFKLRTANCEWKWPKWPLEADDEEKVAEE